MKDLIKTVALVVAKDVDIGANNESTAALVEWVLIHGLAELSKRAEAVAYDVRDSNGDGQTVLAKYVKDPLTTAIQWAKAAIINHKEQDENRSE